MSPALITALCTGIAGVITAVTALIHTIRTRQQVGAQNTEGQK